MFSTKTVIIILLLLAAAFVCYADTLNSGFIWDDNYLVNDNSLVRAPIVSFQPFKQDIVNSSFTYTLYYRPVQILSYAIDYRIWGINPFGFRLTNILLHFFNAVLLFFLIKKLFKNEVIALLTSLFFVVHPAHAAAVAYVSGRADLLFFLFGMLTLLCFIYFREKKRTVFLVLSAVFFMLSVLSKEYALIFLMILPLMDILVLRKEYGSLRVIAYAPFVALAALYSILHYFFLGNKYLLFLIPGNNHFIVSFAKYLKVIGEFLVLCIFPSGLHFRHILTSKSLFFGLEVGLIFSAFIFILLSIRKMAGLLMFSLSVFFLSLVPFMFILNSFDVYAEHWMYLPSCWVLLFVSASLVGFFIRSSVKKKILIAAVILAGITVYTKTSISQNGYFSDCGSLSDNVLEYSSADKAALHFKSIDLYRRGKDQAAEVQMKTAVEQNPTNPRMWYLKGRLDLSLNMREEAKYAFERALELNVNYVNAYVGTALLYFSQKNEVKAIAYLEKALELNPDHPEALMLAGIAYYEIGEVQKANDVIYKSFQVDPYGYDEIVNMGTVFTREGKTREGGALYLKATRLYPEKPVPYYNLAYLFYLSGDNKNARIFADKAILLAPAFQPALDLIRIMNHDRNKEDAGTGT